ncbi:MAG: hydroxymethylbilane synthase [Planctomycetes bacterium]|nr:hydroxymethylbilane synthase [Planctomycetota bacterium]
MTDRLFRLATRASPLALWQARLVAHALRRRHAGLQVTLVPIVSSGDADRSTTLYESSTVGMFVKEIQAAVLSGDADAGVHSCKDLPTASPAGLVLSAMLARADPRDALVGGDLATLPDGALIGTSSLRRQLQLARLRPDLRFAPIRGNVDTRLRKITQGEYQATVLAMAGLTRLGLARSARASALDPFDACVPAPGQGVIAVDCRTSDRRARWLLGAIDHHETRAAATIERAVLAALHGGCSLPLGCYAWREGGRWNLVASLGVDGVIRHRLRIDGTAAELPINAIARLAGR